MLVIEDKILDLDLLKKAFTCNLDACKGACCVEGEAGAPLKIEELSELENSWEAVKPLLPESGKKAIEEKGLYELDGDERRFKTPLRADNACAYVIEENGISLCGIEKAHQQGSTSFRKPISCHLYPIRVRQTEQFTFLDYERWNICNPACSLGEELGVPVFRFCKEAIVREWGEGFYEAMEGWFSARG